jgi:hypothetical protein
MADTAPRPDETDLEAIQVLRQEVPDLLPPEDARRLTAELNKVLRRMADPAARARSTALAREAIDQYPEARKRLDQITAKIQQTLGYRYQGVPGDPQAVPPGILMVCPKDPTHYQKYLRLAGEKLRCPQHQIDLVPQSASR